MKISTCGLVALCLVLVACTQAPAPAIDREPTGVSVRTPGPGEYLVRRGDTLYRIAREQGVDQASLQSLNNISDPTTLREGQIIRLRAASASSASPAPVATAPMAGRPVIEGRPLPEAPAPLSPAATAPPAVAASAPEAPAGTAAATTAQVDGVVWSWPVSTPVLAGYNGTTNKGIDFSGSEGAPVTAAADGRVLYVGEALPGYGKLVILKHGDHHLSVYAHNSRMLVKESQSVKRGQKIAEMGKTGTDRVKLHFEIRKQGKPVDPLPFLPKR